MKHSTESDTNNQSATNNQQRTTHKTDWRLYAAAAGAALEFTTGADASIIYSGTKDLQFGVGGGGFLVGGAQVNVNVRHSTSSNTGAAAVFLRLGNGGSIIKVPNGRVTAINFASGNPIGAASVGGTGILADQQFSSGHPMGTAVGNFAVGHTGFVGLELVGGHPAWIRVEVEGDANGYPDGLEVIDWAYNNAGGLSAGQGVTVPEPSALGLLAMGSAGVLAWRRRRNVKGSV
jgi:hypothetical protein